MLPGAGRGVRSPGRNVDMEWSVRPLMGRRWRFRGKGRRRRGPPVPLSDCPEGVRSVVVANSDHRAMELGLFPGACVTVMRNRDREGSVVVAVGDARYALDREAAREILVRFSRGCFGRSEF